VGAGATVVAVGGGAVRAGVCMGICICGGVVGGFVETVAGFFVFFVVLVFIFYLVFVEGVCGPAAAVVLFFFGLADGAEDAKAGVAGVVCPHVWSFILFRG
jgi:hypothetical protein